MFSRYQGEETTNTIKSPFQKVEVTARTEACSNPMDDTMSVEFDIPAAITESTFQFRYVFSDRHVIGKSAQWTETEGNLNSSHEIITTISSSR